MNIKTSISMMMALVALLFAGCSNDSGNGGAILELDTYELSVDGGGGDIALYYGVTNPVKNAKPSVKCIESWVTLKEVTDSKIVLSIAASDVSEERYAFVNVEYPGADNVRVFITQDMQLLNKFSFEVADVTYKSCKVTYKPLDQSRPYMANIIDAEYFKQSGVTDERAFVDAEMASYLSLAQRNNMTLEELMSRVSPQLIYTGDAVREFAGMQPGATYVVYSYGIEFVGNLYEMTTPMHRTVVELPMPQMYDVKFNISTSLSGTKATISINPGDWAGYYSVQIAPDDSLQWIEPGTNMTDYQMKSLADSFYTRARNAMRSGASADQFLRSNCYMGFRDLDVQLQSGKRYMVIVFAVESKDGEVPVMRSVPTLKYI